MRVATDGACRGPPGKSRQRLRVVGENRPHSGGGHPNVGELLGLTRALTDHADVRDLVIEDCAQEIEQHSGWEMGGYASLVRHLDDDATNLDLVVIVERGTPSVRRTAQADERARRRRPDHRGAAKG